jgi:hypothetical protein
MAEKKRVEDKREHQLLLNGQPATEQEYKRIVNARPQPTDDKELPNNLTKNHGFRLMR